MPVQAGANMLPGVFFARIAPKSKRWHLSPTKISILWSGAVEALYVVIFLLTTAVSALKW